MAGVVGGIVWLPFLVAFVVATLTALSYLELVTKYPQAAGAALYTHKAFGVHFVTFSCLRGDLLRHHQRVTSSNVLAQNLTGGLEANGWIDGTPGTGTITLIALGFMVLLALINLRGVGESVKFNVMLTLVEVTALTIVIGVGFYVIAQGDGSFDRVTTFDNPDDKGLFLAVTAATSIAFFAMVGFEDSVNMVEETKEPERIFPRTLLTGLGIAVIIYMLVAVSVVTVLTSDQIADATDGRALLEVVRVGAPDFPIDKVFPFLAVLRGRQHRADQHADGQPAALRPGQPGRAAARPRQGLAEHAGAVRRHHLLHAAGAGPDHLRRRSGPRPTWSSTWPA